MARYGLARAGSAEAIANTQLSPAAAVASSAVTWTADHDFGFGRRQTADPSRVLIVDADLARCAGIALLVHTVGRFETRRACSSGIALTIATDFLPGFVLISTDLHDLAGYRLASLLHHRPGLFGARLIALTCEIPATDRQAALSAGFEQYLTQPVQQPALERVLLGRSPRSLPSH